MSAQQFGLFDPALEKDSCGVGFIADIKGRKSHKIVASRPLPRDQSEPISHIAPTLKSPNRVYGMSQPPSPWTD